MMPAAPFGATVRLSRLNGGETTRQVHVFDFGVYGLICRTPAEHPGSRTLIPWHRINEIGWEDLEGA